MKSIIKIIQFCCNSLVYFFVSILVFVAVSLSLARVLLPLIEDYKSDIEVWVSDLIGQQIEIATLDAAWYGMEPQLVLRGVQLLSEDRMDTHGYFQQARLGIDLISSVLSGRIQPGAFTIEGARFVLVKDVDGHVSLKGFSQANSTSKSDNNRLLEEWFFKQRLLDVKNSEVVWQDLTVSNKSWLFTDVNLRFRNEEQRHWIDGSVQLPQSLGNRLEVAVDVRGSLLSSNGWAGNAYLEGEKLNIPEISQNFSLTHLNVTRGEMNIRLWTQWRLGKLHSLKGNVKINDVQIAARNAPKIRVLNKVSSNFVIQKQLTEWEITFDKIGIVSGRSIWPKTRFDLKYNPNSGSLNGQLDYLDLAEVLPIIAFFTHEKHDLSRTLTNMKAKGIVQGLSLSMRSVNAENHFLMSGEFSNFQNRAWGQVPSVANLHGHFSLSNRAASIDLPKQNIQLDYRQKFTYQHYLKNFQTSIKTIFDENGFQLVAKDTSFQFKNVSSTGSLTLTKAKVGAQKLDLAFYFNGGNVTDVEYYIPTKIMTESTVDWLLGALQGGTVRQGGVLYYGSFADFPFVGSEGLFNVNLSIEQGTLKFSENWPMISSIVGEFDLQANSFSFFGESGLTKNSTIENVLVSIGDYRAREKHLMISGKTHGKTSDKLDYLFATPIAKDFVGLMEPLQVKGESVLDLNLDIPLLFSKKAKIFGELTLIDNQLSAEVWKLELKKIFANLRFNNDGLWSRNLNAVIKGVELQGDIETTRENGEVNLMIHNSSLVSEHALSRLLDYFVDKAHWADYVQGQSMVDTRLIIPLGANNKNITLSLTSDLTGIEINLPYPLGKKSTEKKSLILLTDLTGKQRTLSVDYGSTHSIFEIVAVSGVPHIARGGIGFKKQVVLPEEIGYRFSGELDEFRWSDWETVLFSDGTRKSLLEDGGGFGSLYFDVAINKLNFLGSEFGATSIQASKTSQLWSLHLAGKNLEGEVFVPVVAASSPLIMDMKRLHFNPTTEQAGSGLIDPRKMPEMKLKVNDFQYGDIPFGQLTLNSKQISNGLRLDSFDMSTKNTTISAKGDWLVVEDAKNILTQKSRFTIIVNSKDFGRAIKSWGYADAINKGEGRIELNVNWPGNPSNFSFRRASGDVVLSIKDTSMLGFDLGAAKMFGLLLPRRLLLDFRDVFSKGMYFDEIKGKYQIEAGEAFTSGLFLNGPVADIHMAGRIGLSKRDYDQVITVNRRIIGDSLPVLAALTVAAPVVAAQVYILKKMFARQIDDILSIQYTVVGSWDDPIITPVIKNPSTGEDLTEDILEE